IHDRNVPHLTEGLCLLLSVKMNMYSGNGNNFLKTFIRRIAFKPRLTQEIYHCPRQQQSCVAQWQTKNRPQMLFILRGTICFDGLMAAVMWPRSNLINQHLAFLCNEHFHCEEAYHVKFLNKIPRNPVSPLRCNGWDIRGCKQ